MEGTFTLFKTLYNLKLVNWSAVTQFICADFGIPLKKGAEYLWHHLVFSMTLGEDCLPAPAVTGGRRKLGMAWWGMLPKRATPTCTEVNIFVFKIFYL